MNRISKISLFIIFLILAYFTIFHQLDKFDLFMWDECRLANNAIEMYFNNEYFVTNYDGQPDMWGTKPPIMIWLQVIFMHILEPGILAIRLPSAIATFLICLVIIYFAKSKLKQYHTGLFAALVLIASPAFITNHVSRTGDYDALLSLFCLLFLLAYYVFIIENNLKYFYAFIIFLALATLTKGVQGLIFVPTIILFTILQKKLIILLKSKHTYFGILIFISTILSYYIYREIITPGYLHSVWIYEVGGRYFTEQNYNTGPFYHYFQQAYDYKFSSLIWTVPIWFIMLIKHPDKSIQKFIQFGIITIFSYLFILSFSGSKCNWYDAPVYPFAAILSGIFLSLLYEGLITKLAINKNYLRMLIFIIILFPLFNDYKGRIEYIMNENTEWWERTMYGKYIENRKNEINKNLHPVNFIFSEYNSHLLYYKNLMNFSYNKNHKALKLQEKEPLKTGDIIISCETDVRNYLEQNYQFEVLDSEKACYTLRIIAPK